MCYRRGGIAANLMLLLGLCVWGVAASPVLAVGATRELPALYGPGVALTVSIAVDAPAGTVAVAVEDSPPAGWTVIANISDGGTYDAANHKVKWWFTSNLSRTVSYEVTPPSNATGEACFSGTVSFDGFDQDIVGADCLSASQGIPTLSEWGVAVMVIGLLATAALVFARRRSALGSAMN